MIVVRTSFKGAPRRIVFNASNTAPLGKVYAGDGDVGSACRLGDPLGFAITSGQSVAMPAVSHKQMSSTLPTRK